MYRSQRRERRLAPRLLALVLVAAGALLALALLRTGPPPSVDVEPALPGIGPRTPVTVRVAEPARGLSSVDVELVQGDRVFPLAERRHTPRPFWAFWGSRTRDEVLELEVGTQVQDGLRAGDAALRVIAGRAGTWLRRPDAVFVEHPLPVRLTPPALEHLAGDVVAQGGSGVVVYRVGETSTRDGVRVGERLFPGSPLPGGEADRRFAFYGTPHDLEDGRAAVRLWAVDELGNEAVLPFLRRFDAKRRPSDTIRLSDGFLERKVPTILARTPELEDPGGLLDTYLAINRELRRRNAATLAEVAADSRPEILWRRPFLQLPGSRVMATFGDRRTYLYDGEEVDRQVHLGYDLASVRRAPVPAAARGAVTMAGDLGIYGNTVVLDHGYGLASLYAHLSEISVTPGQVVDRGDVVGTTGTTGLAGGDHLHFSVLVHGLMVDPLEWWDRRWIENRVAAPLDGVVELEP